MEELSQGEAGAAATVTPLPHTNTIQYTALLNRLARRRLLELCHTVGPDADLYHAHRIKMLEAGWPV